MKSLSKVLFAAALLAPVAAGAEILAMMNYESKPNDSLKDLKMPFGTQGRKEGIAIVDVDPQSPAYGQILADIPLPPDLVAHHLFWNRDHTKLYMTALGKPELRVIDTTRFPYRIKMIPVPDCMVGEDVVFSEDNKTWYQSCMGSSKVLVGDAVKDVYLRTYDSPVKYPHGIAVNSAIDRILVTSTVRASDMGDPGDSIGIMEASTGKPLGSVKVTDKPAPNNVAPVEILFVPDADPPVAWVTNMNDGTLWTLAWNPQSRTFDTARAFDFAEHDAAVPLEMYFSRDGSKLYVSTANPGKMHFFELGADRRSVKLLGTLDAANGAHHIAFTKDGRYAYVQNSLLNLPGMSDGSVTVVDLNKRQVIGSMDTLKDNGFNPNCIVLLADWNDPMGH